MKQWQYYTVDGMSDVLTPKIQELRRLEGSLMECFSSMAYQEVATPGVEYYDVYAKASLVPQEELFKLVDEQGRLLCLRYDGTIPCLRLAASKFADSDFPLRLSYLQTMYRFNENGGARKRSFRQAGVELLGIEGPEADAELISVALTATRHIGIKDVQIGIGNGSFLLALLQAWQCDAAAIDTLVKLLEAKNMIAAETKAGEFGLAVENIALLRKLFAHPLSVSEALAVDTASLPGAAAAEFSYIQNVLRILTAWGWEASLTVDLSLLRSMNYYTGLSFKGYAYGLAYPLFSGGRYDNAASAFGKKISASGFSIGLDMAYQALRSAGLLLEEQKRKLLLAAVAEAAERLGREIPQLTAQGYVVELCHGVSDLAALKEIAGKRQATHYLLLADDDKIEINAVMGE